MSARLHPGVYVEEVASGIRAIEGVPTSTTIFVGETERGPLTPTKIKGRTEYERLFGGYRRALAGGGTQRVLMPLSLDGFFQNGGSSCYVLRILDDLSNAARASRKDGATPLVEAADEGVWGNSLRVVICKSSDDDNNRWRYAVLYTSPEDGNERIVENWDKLSSTPSDENYVVDVLRRSLYIRWPANVTPARPTTIDENPPVGTAVTDAAITGSAAPKLSGGLGGGASSHVTGQTITSDFLPRLEGIDDAALLVAAAEQMLDGSAGAVSAFTDITNSFIGYCEAQRPRQDLFFVGDLPRLVGNSVSTSVQTAVSTKAGLNVQSDFSGLFWPHLRVGDPIGAGKRPSIVIPPSGHVAGIFARTDGRRGVWKAPAGVEAGIAGMQELDLKLLDSHSGELNPKGINALRLIPGAGSVVWGSRTMEPSSEQRYISVRRTAMFLRGSIYNGIQWAVFEPNDTPLWDALRTSIGAFMEVQFRNGAFAGKTSKQAYFVKCDEETTPESDRAAGIVNVLVGFAPLRPAEFVVVKLSQKTADN